MNYKEKQSLKIAEEIDLFLKNGGKIKQAKPLQLDKSRKPTGFSERLA